MWLSSYCLRNVGYWNSIEDMVMGHFLVKMKDDVSDKEIDSVVAMLQASVRGQSGTYVQDYRYPNLTRRVSVLLTH